jgi:hypothetical protein
MASFPLGLKEPSSDGEWKDRKRNGCPLEVAFEKNLRSRKTSAGSSRYSFGSLILTGTLKVALS